MRICRCKRSPPGRYPHIELLFQRSYQLGRPPPATSDIRACQSMPGDKCYLFRYACKRGGLFLDRPGGMEYHGRAGNKLDSRAYRKFIRIRHCSVLKLLRERTNQNPCGQPSVTPLFPRRHHRPGASVCGGPGCQLFDQSR